MLAQRSKASSLASLSPADRAAFLADLTDTETLALAFDWSFWARPAQLTPPGDWTIWLNLAGRGFGKTRTGAEWVRNEVEAGRLRRIAIVAPTAADARKVIVEGESGILATSPPWFRPTYAPSRRQIIWPNGAMATLYSAEEPDRLRGPQHDGAWCDELAAWKYVRDTWDQLQFGLRLGDRPRQVITTTPRPIPVLKEILARPDVVVTRGATEENAPNLAPTFLSAIVNRYQGTRLGRQELGGELLEEVVGALWSRSLIEQSRVTPADVPNLVRVVVAIDPGVSSNEDSNETGIVCAGVGTDGHAYLLDDASAVRKPGGADGWAAEAIALLRARKGDRIVAEVNNGGEMVENTLRVIDPSIPYRAVHATRGKVLRAEPVSALYEQGRVHHVGTFAHLEDQMCSFTPEFDRSKDGSPDRLDALVWAVTELMVHEGVPAVAGADKNLVCDPITIPPEWPRVYALAMSRDRVGVVWGAINKQEDTVYLYAEYAAPRADLAVHAAAIRDRAKWVPGVFAPKADGRALEEGAAIVTRLEDLSLEITAAAPDPDAALEQAAQRIAANRLRVFRNMSGWTAEFRTFRRDDRGKLVGEGAELMAATALLCASGIDAAIVEPKKPRFRSNQTRSAWGA